tara:strand:+ start:201 stop:431 length:231 start_codon:yes stop_codon:yes gene_type:complete
MRYIRVFLTSAPTYLGLAAVVIGILLDELLPLLPDHLAAQVAGVAASILAILAAVGMVIRRVTPVLPEDRGILPFD